MAKLFYKEKKWRVHPSKQGGLRYSSYPGESRLREHKCVRGTAPGPGDTHACGEPAPDRDGGCRQWYGDRPSRKKGCLVGPGTSTRRAAPENFRQRLLITITLGGRSISQKKLTETKKNKRQTRDRKLLCEGRRTSARSSRQPSGHAGAGGAPQGPTGEAFTEPQAGRETDARTE